MNENVVSIGWTRVGYRVAVLEDGERSVIERIATWAEATTIAANHADRVGLFGLYRGIRE